MTASMMIDRKNHGTMPREAAPGLFQDPDGGPGGRAGVAVALVVALSALTGACTRHEVKVEAPDKPIEINLNIKIEQEVRVKVERDVEQLIEQNPDIY